MAVWRKYFFMYKFVSLLTKVITVHKDIKNTFRELLKRSYIIKEKLHVQS